MMRSISVLVLSFLAGCSAPALPDFVEDPLSYVDPRIGTGGLYFGVGSGFAGAAVPFGLAKPGPDTTGPNGAASYHHCSGYHYDDDIIVGFSQVHIHGTGAPDYGALMFMPVPEASGTPWSESDHQSRFEKSTEVMRPGYYSVVLADSGIEVELAATERCALHRYTFPEGLERAQVVIDLGHAIAGCEVLEGELSIDAGSAEVAGRLVYSGALTGRSGGVELFFAARFDRSFSGWSAWADKNPLGQVAGASGADTGVVLEFDGSGPLVVRIGLSYVDLEGARSNLAAEAQELPFDEAVAQAEEKWAPLLERVRVAGGTEKQRTIFYTGLYHALLTPTVNSDSDGRYRGFDGEIHGDPGFTYYTDFSLWDTYRTVHQLFTLAYPEYERDMVLSLLDMGRRLGRLPRWPAGRGDSGSMVGAPAEIVIAETCLRGLCDFGAEDALGQLVADAEAAPPAGGREGFERYLELGYLPADEHSGAAAKTLEFAVADAAVAALARKLGREEVAQRFEQRAGFWRNLYDEKTGFFRARNADGSFIEPFDPLDWNARDYVEGTAWQYLWLVPHDPDGLAELLGGKEAAAEKLEAFFTTPEPEDPLGQYLPPRYYWHGNEPDLHAAYLFNHFGRPDLAQLWARNIMAEKYGTGPDGLAGNDDCGTLSAWYVLSAAGIFPMAATSLWEIGSPVFERVLFDAGDRSLEIRAPGASQRRLYVESARLDGRRLSEPRFDAAELGTASVLELAMRDAPGDWR